MSSPANWSQYWSDPDTDGGCIPQASPGVHAAVRDRWEKFASSIDADARVLDLACGLGAAGSAVLEAQSGCTVEGVDYAAIGTDSGLPFPIRGGVDIAALPYEDGAFDVAISQFGIEYAGDEAVAEMARILRGHGQVCLLVHHAESVIVQSNRKRGAILTRMLDTGLPALVASKDRQRLQSVFNALVQDFGEDPLVLEIATACRDAMRMEPDQGKGLLNRIAEGMGREAELLSAMSSAALDDDGTRAFMQRAQTSIDWREPSIVQHDDNVLCWELSGNRKDT